MTGQSARLPVTLVLVAAVTAVGAWVVPAGPGQRLYDDAAQFAAGALAAYEYEAVSAPYTKVGADVLRILYHSDSLIPAPSGYFANLSGLNSPALDELLTQAASEADATARGDIYRQVQQEVLEGFYILPLYDQQNHFLTQGVTGVRALGTVATATFLDAYLQD